MNTKYFLKEKYVLKLLLNTPNLNAQRLPFCLFECGHFNCDDKYFTKRKGLNNYLLIYTISGSGLIKYQTVEYEVNKDSCFLINCEEYHHYKTAPNNNWDFYYIHFSGMCAKEYYDIINGNSLNIIDIQNRKYIHELFNELFALISNKTELIDIKTSLNISKILTLVIEEGQNSSNKQFFKHKVDIDKVRDYIHKNFDKEIDILSLAQSVNISKFYFINLFKELIGQTPYEYLIGIRINASKKLLKETDLSVKEIANSVGFSDINSYIKSFKKLTGTTPLKYKLHWFI